MVYFVRRTLIYYDELKPGEYTQVGKKHLHGRTALVVLRCPTCKNLTTTTREHHSVDYDGNVEPAIKCPHDDCTFEDLVSLTDWMPEPAGRA